jgi:hypothetical protein
MIIGGMPGHVPRSAAIGLHDKDVEIPVPFRREQDGLATGYGWPGCLIFQGWPGQLIFLARIGEKYQPRNGEEASREPHDATSYWRM